MITSYYPKPPADPANDPAPPMKADTPIWRHIRITNVTATDSPHSGLILGLAEAPVEDIVLTKVHISAAKGMQIVHAKGIRFVDWSITVETRPAIKVSDGEVAGLNLESGHSTSGKPE